MFNPGIHFKVDKNKLFVVFANIDLIYTTTYSTMGEVMEHQLVLLDQDIEEIP
jgi:hypothetical protein